LFYTIRGVESQGYRLTGAIKTSGNQGIDLAFRGRRHLRGRFALAEAKSGRFHLDVDTKGIQQASFRFFETRLAAAGRRDLLAALYSGRIDSFGGYAGKSHLWKFDLALFRKRLDFRTRAGRAARTRVGF
jgi:hypothetical protein